MSIKFENLRFGYSEEGKPLFEDFSAEFDEKKITVLTGVSGCGKSTMLYLAAGLYPANGGHVSGGRVTVNGTDPAGLAPAQRCRAAGMMFQNPDLQFCMDTVKNEIVFCLENICEEPEQIGRAVDKALAFIGISHLKGRLLNTLSGGEKQKVALACISALRPRWLLLDEPFANIDSAASADIAAKLGELHEKYGVGILAVDHRLDTWLGIADEVRVMEEGRILPEAMDINDLDPAKLEEHGIIVPGHSYGQEITARCDGEKVLELRHLSLSYGDNTILRDVNAVFRAGSIYALVGESGSGKSSLFDALAGINRYSGEALLKGQDLKARGVRKKTLGAIGFVTQNPQDQFVGGNVRQEILISLKGREGAEDESETILKDIRLWRYREVSPYLLSQGQQRRLGVAALMAYDCKVLICDEPTYAQDRKNTIAIMSGLCRQARENGVALIFSTHDRQLAADYADEVLALEGGELHAAH